MAIRVGDGRTIHSLGGVDVTVCLGPEEVTQHCKVLDTDAFDPLVKLLSLQRPYTLHCNSGSGLYSVPLELPGLKESGLRYVNRSYRTENYQLVRPVLEKGLAALQLDLNEIQVELFASKEQHLMQLYCSWYLNNAYRFYWGSMGLCYANPPFSQLAKVITKIALEGARMVLCTPDWGTTGEHTYWRRLLDRMTVGRTELPNGPIYIWKVMPFGVANAPALFQELMNKILYILRRRRLVQELVSREAQMEAHIDDLSLGTNTQEDHILLLQEFFTVCQENHLRIKLEKCEFMREEMEYLGFDVGYGWWKPAASKMQFLQDMQIRDDPKKGLHDVRSFIGACNFYRRHIHNFTYSSAPLTDPIKKTNPWRWTDKEEACFQELKR